MAACAAGADVSCLAHQGGEVWGRRGTGCAGPMRLSCAWAGRRNADLCQQHCWGRGFPSWGSIGSASGGAWGESFSPPTP